MGPSSVSRKTNALEMRRNLGKALRQLARAGEPILVERNREPTAGLISLRDWQERFVIDASVAIKWGAPDHDETDRAAAVVGPHFVMASIDAVDEPVMDAARFDRCVPRRRGGLR